MINISKIEEQAFYENDMLSDIYCKLLKFYSVVKNYWKKTSNTYTTFLKIILSECLETYSKPNQTFKIELLGSEVATGGIL